MFHYNRKLEKENVDPNTPEGKIVKAKQARFTPARKRNDQCALAAKPSTDLTSSSEEE